MVQLSSLSAAMAWAPEQAHTEAFQEKAAATPHTATGHLCQSRTGASANEGSVLQVAFRDTQWASPAAHCYQDRHSNSPLPNPSSEKGEKSAKSPAGLTKWRAQHWNKVIYNQEKGRKPLLLEAASHWSVQLHTAQKSNYTNTLCVRFPIKCVFH